VANSWFDRYIGSGGRPDAWEFLRIARTYLEIGDTTNCIRSLKQAIQKGSVWNEEGNSLSIATVFTDEQLMWLRSTNIQYEQFHKIHLQQLDTALINRIAAMAARDQYVRLHDRNILSEEEFIKRLRETDSLHLAEVRSIFLQHNGFPADSLITRKAESELTLMIQHFIRGFPETFDYFAEIVKKAIDRDQLSPSEYAVMVDRRQYKIDGKTIYGEVPRSDGNGGSTVDNIADIDQVDSLRYSIGLRSLRDHSIFRGFELPSGYTELKQPCE
jgi:hypothetical protein